MIDHNIELIKIREILDHDLCYVTEVDVILKSGAFSRVQYRYNKNQLSHQVKSLINKSSALVSIDAELMKLELENILPLSIVVTRAAATSHNQSFIKYLAYHSGRVVTLPKLIIPIWQVDDAAKHYTRKCTALRAIYLVLDIVNLRNKIGAICKWMQSKKGKMFSLLNNQEIETFNLPEYFQDLDIDYLIGCQIDLTDLQIENLDSIIYALKCEIVITTGLNEDNANLSIMMHHRYGHLLQVITQPLVDHAGLGIIISDDNIVTLSYLADYVKHLNLKSGLCCIMHNRFEGHYAANLADISCALGVSYIVLKDLLSSDSYLIINQLLRITEDYFNQTSQV